MQQPTTIWVTGASGFLGANIVEFLLKHNYNVVATIRSQTDFWRCNEFLQHPNFNVVNIDNGEFEQQLKKYSPSILIHSAWAGVALQGRDDWNVQFENIQFTYKMLSLAHKVKVQKIITLGSQAEYGLFNGRIDEQFLCNPNSAYGAAKVAAYQITKQFCTQHQIEYCWLRLFAMFGKKEDSTWLMSSVINNILNHKEINLTACQQRYDYVDMNFLMYCLHQVVQAKNKSGVYNVGSNTAIMLKNMVALVAQKLSDYTPQVNFGALAYRPNQVMHMEGDSTKFYTTFNIEQKVNLEAGLDEVIADLKQKMK